MQKVSAIGSLLKKIYRNYNTEILSRLEERGFTDLRPSFLEVLLIICELDGPSIKVIGKNCGLKKQTMTSHLNELVKRGYVERRMNPNDKREQRIFLTEYGQRFKLSLFETVSEVEKIYTNIVGDIELERIEHILSSFHHKVFEQETKSAQTELSLF